VRAFWEAFVAGLPTGRDPGSCDAWSFGDSAEMGDRLGRLVTHGPKRATAGSLRAYEREGEPLPHEGGFSLILDGRGDPLCVIETTEVAVRPFREVDDTFAFDEGEGDRSLAYWRAAHTDFFTREAARHGERFGEDDLVVCERFRVVYPSEVADG
jgi:uncharacterized protein YhfF